MGASSRCQTRRRAGKKGKGKKEEGREGKERNVKKRKNKQCVRTGEAKHNGVRLLHIFFSGAVILPEVVRNLQQSDAFPAFEPVSHLQPRRSRTSINVNIEAL